MLAPLYLLPMMMQYFSLETKILTDSVFDNLQSFIYQLSQWLQSNKLTPNISKTKLMIFNPRISNILPQIFFNNNEIVEFVENFKYLGFIMEQQNLNFKHHTEHLYSKLSKVQGLLYAARHYFNKKSLILIYYSLAYSAFTQSIIILVK